GRGAVCERGRHGERRWLHRGRGARHRLRAGGAAMTRRALASLAFVAVATAGASAAHAVPTQVAFAGRIVDASGPINGTVDLGFRLYGGGTQVWSEDHAGVTADQGLISVSLGSVTALDDTIF